MLNYETALTLARRLTVIREFPRYTEAVEAVAEDLVLLTQDAPNPDYAEARARWLVTEMRQRWSEWGGADQMAELYRRRYRPPVPPGNAVQVYEKIPIECQVCNDTGVVKSGGRESAELYQWCECQMGISLHFSNPDLLDRLYNRVTPQKPEPPPPVNPEVLFIRPEVETKLETNPTCPGCENPPHTVSQYWQFHAFSAGDTAA